MDTIDVEEVEITGIDHQQADKVLALRGRQAAGMDTRIVFAGVAWWELCSFGIQNVLRSIDSYEGHSLTDALVLEHDIPQQYCQSVQAGQHRLFVLNERVGLSGWIIAAHVQVEADGQQRSLPKEPKR